ncbi:pesticin C-terminus-like muramidase [Massilia rubra]|uniref:Pesticin C-terminal domain-containing protein n=1 Tax=Massilia rubra TaxID=2607910 RepID=A0ABX0LNC9_9BURK|nr:pesticin C-terminus-like muramidase [Massilia rubra]NHZ33004.1 hypothetical protein [Massilia rubra]
MPRKISISSRPARTEENLSEADKYELQQERNLIAEAKACQVNARLARLEMAKLNKQRNGLAKKDPDMSILSREIGEKIRILQAVANKECAVSHFGCVPSNTSKKIIAPKSMGEEINETYGTKIDFEKISFFEGGEHTVAYIPWWPYLKNDRPTIKFYSKTTAKEIPRLAGYYKGKPDNRSGATIGIGVDLGQSSAQTFLIKMKTGNMGSQKISEKELSELHEKIRPYFQKFGGEACKFLRENPLILSAKESHFLNKVAHEEALKIAIDKYDGLAAQNHGKKFLNLSLEQQTALLSNSYQKGSPDMDLIMAIIHQNGKEIPPTVREYEYLLAAMGGKKEKLRSRK